MPRDVERMRLAARWPRTARGTTLLSAVFTAGALLVALTLAQQAIALRDHGRLGTAVITDDDGKWFDADLQLPGGRTVHATELERADLTVKPTVGARFTALYDPDDPSNLVDAENGPDWLSAVSCGLVTVVFTGMTIAAARGAFHRKR